MKIEMKTGKIDLNRRVGILLTLICVCLSMQIFAESFTIHYNLPGVPRIENGLINLYNIPAGLSMSRSQAIIFREMEMETRLEVDYENREMLLKPVWGTMEDLYPPVTISIEEFYQQNFRKEFREQLFEKSMELLEEKDRSSGQGLIGDFTFKLPPGARKSKIVRNLLGNKAGSLSLDGSEKITIGGSSSTSNRTTDETGNNRDFDLNMMQELNLRLRGTIGEKIHVNVNHQSSSDDVFGSSQDVVEISYEGTEDEVIKKIEGGNIALSLSGSQYISYSASSEGLFGIKSQMEVGDLDVTLILGKDEAEKNQQEWEGGSKSDSTSIVSENYEIRHFYYITDPEELYLLYGDAEGDAVYGSDYPEGYAGNAIRTVNGDWVMRSESQDLLPVPGTLHVYFDNGTTNDENITIPGMNLYDTSDTKEYEFEELIEDSDFTFNYDTGLLYINRSIDKLHSIGVTYEQQDGTQIGNDTAEYSTIEVKIIKMSNQNKEEDPEYWKLEARNIYNFGENIQSEGFEVYVYDDLAADGTQTLTCPEEICDPLPSGTSYNEYLRLDTNGDGIVNGEDETVSLAAGYLTFPFLEPFRPVGDEEIYEEDPSYVQYDEIHMHIVVKGKISQDQINLDAINILPGSVTVTLGEGATKRELNENVDYIVDYDFGMVTLLLAEAKDPDASLSITYDYKPTFSIDSKTLAGFRADWNYSDRFNLGATFVYQDEQVQDEHPQIGNENKTLILSDIDGQMEYELPYLTKAIDWLPLIATDEDSKITVSGEVAMSIPKLYGNPDNPEEAYIDDMESILESFPLGVVRSSWVPASKPYGTNLAKAIPNWYNPQDIYRRDVYDPESLTTEEEKEEVQVMAIKLDPPNLYNPGTHNRYWGGVMKYLGNQLDFSTKRYVEVLVKVDSLNQNQKPIVMHVDLGDINEDFYTDFGGEGVLNTEDGINGGVADGQLDIYDDVDEDIGLDGIATGEPGDDPEDDYDGGKNEEGEYPDINGTEGNKKLDTEDLDNNGELNDSDVYFEYSVTLEDTTYLESVYNDWYLYRIPVDDEESYREVTNKNVDPDLERISFARVWFEVEEKARIKLINVDMIGNKWETSGIRDEDEEYISEFDLDNNREKMQVSVVDNQKNTHYTPAPGTVIKEDGEETLEQSLMIDYTNLLPGHHGLVRQKFYEAENLLNYNRIRFWVYSEKPQSGADDVSHDLVIRIGADSTNYYEINYPMEALEYETEMAKDDWTELDLDFALLTYLKSPDTDDSSYVEVDSYYSYYQSGDIRVEKHKSPTLSNIKEISLGVENNSNQAYSGRIYFNDIRVAEPYNDIGYAARGSVDLQMADLASFDFDTEWKTDNFQNSATRTTSVPNTYETTSLNINGNINLHKFFPVTWGLNIPLALSRQETHKTGRFMSNSDILWEYLNEEDQEREQTHYLKYRADLSLKLNKSPNTSSKLWNGFVDHTFKATDVSGWVEKKYDVKPTSTDTTFSYQLKHSYKLNIPKDKVDIGILKNYKIYFFPQSFNNTLTYKAELPDGRRWRWSTTGDSAHWEPSSNVVNTVTLTTSTSLKYDLSTDFGADYSLKTTRDMLLEQYWQDYNIGTEKTRDQSINFKYDPKYFDRLMTFVTSLKIKYSDKTRKTSYSSDDDDYYYEGGVDRDFNARFTLKNHDIMMSFVDWLWKDRGNEVPDDKMEDPANRDFVEEIKKPGEKPEEEFRKPGERPEDELFKPDLPKTELEGDDGELEETEEEDVSKPKINLIKEFVKYIGGLENFSVTFDNGYSTDYDDLEERPPFEYQLGIPHVLVEEDIEDSTGTVIQEKEITQRQDSNSISISSGFPIWKNLTTDLSFDWNITQKYTSSTTQTITTNFPNVRVTLSDFQNLLGISEVLKSSSLTSSYAVNNKKTGVVDWEEPNSDETSISFNPLLSWQGNWIKNITTRFNLNHSQTERIQYQEQGNIINDSQQQSATVDVSWSFSAEKGLKIPFFKDRLYIKNDATLSMNVSYSRSYGTRTGYDGETQKDEDQVNLSVKPQVSYEFSKSITAGLSSEYRINNNNKTNNKLTTFSLSMWVEILF